MSRAQKDRILESIKAKYRSDIDRIRAALNEFSKVDTEDACVLGVYSGDDTGESDDFERAVKQLVNDGACLILERLHGWAFPDEGLFWRVRFNGRQVLSEGVPSPHYSEGTREAAKRSPALGRDPRLRLVG